MPQVHVEVEAKYDVDDGVPVPDLAELANAVRDGGARDGGDARGAAEAPSADADDPWTEGDVVVHRLGATYFDSAELDLAAAGLTLRRRTGGEDAGWHLKVPMPDGSRSEIRVPLEEGSAAGGADAHTVPDRLVTMTCAHTLGRPLVPVARLETERTVHHLVDSTGRVLLELADDRVTARRLSPSVAPGEAVDDPIAWREIEVEVVDGPRDLLAALDPALRARGMQPAAGGSKLRRALGLPPVTGTPSASAPPGTDPSRTAGDVAVAYLRAQVDQIRTQDLPVRLDVPDAVHAMRVATRRLRSALTTFGSLLDRDAARRLRGELRWLARSLGAVRDAEVVRDRVLSAMAAESGTACDTASETASDTVGAELDRTYGAARDALLEDLDSPRYRELLTALARVVEAPPLSGRAAEAAGAVLPGRARRAYEELLSAMADAGYAVDPDDRTHRLHEARKAAKRARYAADAVAPAVGGDAAELAAALAGLQDALGEHLDAVAARDRLRDLAAATEGPTAFTLGRLHALEEVHADRSLGHVESAWQAATRERLRPRT